MDILLELDKVVRSLVNAIEDIDLASDTIIVFTSDNGGLGAVDTDSAKYNHLSGGPLCGSKSSIYKGGHSIPFIMRFDNHFPVSEK